VVRVKENREIDGGRKSKDVEHGLVVKLVKMIRVRGLRMTRVAKCLVGVHAGTLSHSRVPGKVGRKKERKEIKGYDKS